MEDEKLPYFSKRYSIRDVKPTKDNIGMAYKERTFEVTHGNQEVRTVEVKEGTTVDVKDQSMKDDIEDMIRETNELAKKYHWTFVDTLRVTT